MEPYLLVNGDVLYWVSLVCRKSVMIETNPIRQRITDLNDRVLSLRGYL